MSEPVRIPLCRHIKTNGHRCKSPAMRGTALCFFHRNVHRTHRRPQTAESLMSTWQESTIEGYRLGGEDPLTIAQAYPRQNEIHFPPLEDAESVQLATSMLFQAIATGSIHFRRAKLLLQTLKIATLNVRAVTTAARFIPDDGPVPTHIVRTAHGHLLAVDDDAPVPDDEEELAPDDDQELPGEPIDEPEPEEEPAPPRWKGPTAEEAKALYGSPADVPTQKTAPVTGPAPAEPAPEHRPEPEPPSFPHSNRNAVNDLEVSDDPAIIYPRKLSVN